VKPPGLQYESPRRFSLWQRAQLAVIPPVVAIAYKRLAAMCVFDMRDKEHFWNTYHHQGRILIAFWHEYLGLAACHFAGFPGAHTLTSYSFDGEMAARTVARFDLKSLRGSSSRGGVAALSQLQAAAEQGMSLGWTLDGPRGPRRKAKGGIAYLAAQTGMPIVPNAYALSSCWRLKSWDRFAIPKPGARILVAFAPPIAPPADTSRDAIEATRREVEEALNTLHAALEAELDVSPD